MSDRQQVATLTLVSTSQTLTIFTAMMPEFSTVRKSHNDPELKDSVRTAEITASVVALTIGFGVSIAARSSTPFIATLLLCGVLAATYEYICYSTPRIEGNNA